LAIAPAPLEILRKYWNYPHFRYPQDKIIDSVIEKRDTLAILPTGAGKSICFQVPAIYLGGTTLVVSPLIALMSDQVFQLKKRGLNAYFLHAGMSKSEQEKTIDTCRNLDYCLLYISPEKLNSQWFQERIHQLHIRLVAIDEAHCISQWGYDFRPEYLKISESIVELDCVKIALTASATVKVQKDILEKLTFKNYRHFSSSVYRPNLSYQIVKTDDKINQLVRMLSASNESTIIYCKSRKMCQEIAQTVNTKGFKSTYYHAGLTKEQRHEAQNSWISGQIPIIAATNAFGMGIDKPNVRQVIHLGAPNAIEAYYQEAGRAGRDGEESTVTILSSEKDKTQASGQIEMTFQPLEIVQQVFQALCNQYQLAEGSFSNNPKTIDYQSINKRTGLDFNQIHYSLKLLDLSSIINYQTDNYTPPKLLITQKPDLLFALYESNPQIEEVLKNIIRFYGAAIYEEYQIINESHLAQLCRMDLVRFNQILQFLDKNQVINYQSGTDLPVFQLLIPRPPIKKIPLNFPLIQFLKKRALEQLQWMYDYIDFDGCKQQFLAEYFGNDLDENCKKCTSCQSIDQILIDGIEQFIQKNKQSDLDELKTHFEHLNILFLAKHLDFLIFKGRIEKNSENKFVVKEL
jgi:ATP-dependent DNA helicase RecQ